MQGLGSKVFSFWGLRGCYSFAGVAFRLRAGVELGTFNGGLRVPFIVAVWAIGRLDGYLGGGLGIPKPKTLKS